MSDAPQHCPACDTEYVASARVCADCGGPLAAGPPPRYTGRTAAAQAPESASDSAAGAPPAAAFDALLATLPGLQADRLVRMLLLEEVPCAIECDGVHKVYTAPPAQPYAVTLPVSVYVQRDDLDTAQEIAATLEADDLIGDQWSDGAPAEEHREPVPSGTTPPDDREPLAPAEDAPAAPPLTATPIQPERSPLLAVVIVVAIVAAAWFLLAR